MNNCQLNANTFFPAQHFRDESLASLLACCVEIYKDIVAKNKQMENQEEKIRDLFYDDYLSNDDYRDSHDILNRFDFTAESKEKTGCLDIRAKTINPYISTKAYFSIECKRLDGKSHLNAEYVKNGICRYVTDYYSTYFDPNAMFGFVVEQIDIDKNIEIINGLLPKNYKNQQGETVNAKATKPIQHSSFANSYPYSYLSTHTHVSGKEIVLYHLMFDFSNNII